jgi:hypothetical protein
MLNVSSLNNPADQALLALNASQENPQLLDRLATLTAINSLTSRCQSVSIDGHDAFVVEEDGWEVPFLAKNSLNPHSVVFLSSVQQVWGHVPSSPNETIFVSTSRSAHEDNHGI